MSNFARIYISFITHIPELTKEMEPLENKECRDVLMGFVEAYFQTAVIPSKTQSDSIVKFIFEASVRLSADHQAHLYTRLITLPQTHASATKTAPLIRRLIRGITTLPQCHQARLYSLLNNNLSAVPEDLRTEVTQNALCRAARKMQLGGH